MPENTANSHTRDDLWSRINTQSESIAEIRTGQAATDARLGALETAVQHGFSDLASEIHNLAERVHRPEEKTNPVLLLVSFVTVLAMFGSFALLIADPLDHRVATNHAELNDVEQLNIQAREKISILEGQIDVLLRYAHLPAHENHSDE